jgi:predicted nucleic acid-binding protein
LSQFLRLDIAWIDPPLLPIRASELAKEFQCPNTGDAFYLAQAEFLGCPLWTADERLYNAVRSRFGLVHWLGEA